MRPRPETHDPNGGTRDLRHRTLKLGPRPETRDWDPTHGWDLGHKTQAPKKNLRPETQDLFYTWDSRPETQGNESGT